MDKGTFNLVDEPWIPVLFHTGDVKRVGVLEALTRAHEIRDVAASNPMDRLAVLRLLLALLYWCRGNPPKQSKTELGEPFPPSWFKKIRDNRDSFNLFDKKRRFYQTYPTKKDDRQTTTPCYLIHEIPTGTNIAHFFHARDGRDGLCPACCALGLTRLPLFTTQMGRGKGPGVNGKPPIYIIMMGRSVAATLRLNWHPHPDLGAPTWEDQKLNLLKRGGVPLLKGMTWSPRLVWLGEPSEPQARCVGCGQYGPLVRETIYNSLPSVELHEWDPWVIYNYGPKGETDIRPLRPNYTVTDFSRSFREWIKILGEVVGHAPPDGLQATKLWTVSFVSDQAKYIEVVDILYEVPKTLPAAEPFGQKVEAWRRWQPYAERVPQAAFAPLIPAVESRVSARARELVTAGDDAWLKAAEEYSPLITAAATSLYPDVTAKHEDLRRKTKNMSPAAALTAPPVTKKRERKEGNK